MSARDAAALKAVRSIPRDGDNPVFPAPWAARAFAMALAMHERGLFTWAEWSDALAVEIAGAPEADGDAEAYWRAWLAALEWLLTAKSVARPGDLDALRDAWREAAEATPHGQPIELAARRQA